MKAAVGLHSYPPHETGCCRCPRTTGKMSLIICTSSTSENSHGSEKKKEIKVDTHTLEMNFQGTSCFNYLDDSFKLAHLRVKQLVSDFGLIENRCFSTAREQQKAGWGLESSTFCVAWREPKATSCSLHPSDKPSSWEQLPTHSMCQSQQSVLALRISRISALHNSSTFVTYFFLLAV